MKKLLIFIFLVFNLNISLAQENKNLKNDSSSEIKKIENEIAILEKKLEILKANKKNNKNNNVITNISPSQKQVKGQKQVKVGLALSGGGVKGLAHIGVLKALEEQNIKIDYISGTSIGALIAALYSTGHSFDEMEKIVSEISLKNFLDLGKLKYQVEIDKKDREKAYPLIAKFDEKLSFSFPKGIKNSEHLYLNLKDYFKSYPEKIDFHSLPIPISLISLDLNTGKSLELSKGDLAKSIAASIALPSLFYPVQQDDLFLIDAGSIMNLPVDAAFDMGADIVIASDITAKVIPKKDYNIASVLNQVSIIQNNISSSEQIKKATILIVPDVQEYNVLSNVNSKELIKRGIDASLKVKNELELLPKGSLNPRHIKIKDKNNITINEIVYTKVLSSDYETIVNRLLEDILRKNISLDKLKLKINEIYNLDFIDQIFYTVEDDKLELSIESEPKNIVGMGLNYNSHYAPSINLITIFHLKDNLTNNIIFRTSLSEYFSASLESTYFSNLLNKRGVSAKLEYRNMPFFLYDNNFMSAKFLESQSQFSLSASSKFGKNTELTSEVAIKSKKLKIESGDKDYSYINNSNKYLNLNLTLNYDSLESLFFAKSGTEIKNFFQYETILGNYSNPSYVFLSNLKKYFALTDRSTISTSLRLGAILGENLKPNSYIKIGGLENNFNYRQVLFHGFKPHQKLAKSFMIGDINFTYNLANDFYLTSNFNILTLEDANIFNRISSEKLFEKLHYGASIGIQYESKLGPVEFNISKSNDSKQIISTFSIGYKVY